MGELFGNAEVDKRGRVVCPTCQYAMPVPDTHVLNTGWARCPNGHKFYINEKAVEAFHFFLSRQGSETSKELSKDRQELPRDMADGLRGAPEK